MLSEQAFHPVEATQTYVTVILPLAIPKRYTYSVPEYMVPKVAFGKRVEVQFGKSRLYTAIIVELHNTPPEAYKPKAINAVIDNEPIVNPIQVKLWDWIAGYYVCTIGEVMHAALPANLKLASETRIVLSPLFDDQFDGLDDKEYLIAEALTIQEEISIDDVRGILQQKTVYPLIRSMLEKKIIYLKEDLKQKYQPKKVACVRLQEPFATQPELLQEAFDRLSRSTRQVEALMAYIQLERDQDFIRKQDIYKMAKVDSQVINAIAKKGIFELYDKEVSRLGSYEEATIERAQLSKQQEQAIREISTHFESRKPVLLHGVTGSGKTRVYVELINEMIKQGKQALYLLPEIALTTHITSRLEKIFGDKIAVYHSRLNNNERVELWNEVLEGKSVVLGARSALFLPFQKLGLVVIDEEHDPSYKQYDPNPRYNARDAAIYLAHLHKGHVILGTATPSMESFYNTKKGKYGLVEMPERFGGLQLPKVELVNAKDQMLQGKLHTHFTEHLLDELRATLERGEQAILFQNRRGYSPSYRCEACDWHAECVHCDVSLTYHKFHNLLRCHYCGYSTKMPRSCPACGAQKLSLKGFGTEKIEDELKIYLPDAKIGRMDLDTVRGKNAHAKLINDFEEGRINILVGTQMVTKGLDFEKVGLVGVLSADQLLHFPDFRANERAFQLMTQVSGRAGRKHKQGKVLIQAFNTTNPVLADVLKADYHNFFSREIGERQSFQYPPFFRLIRISLKHKKPQTLNDGARIFESILKPKLGEWIKGPAIPYISRVRTYYLLDFLVKLPKDAKKMAFIKHAILEATDKLHQESGFSNVRVSVDVDPY
jgi:primosomal protein N' (replication factor Y)